jgi:hypothetical protein
MTSHGIMSVLMSIGSEFLLLLFFFKKKYFIRIYFQIYQHEYVNFDFAVATFFPTTTSIATEK